MPDSREGIFKDRSLGPTEKIRLASFFKLVREHLGVSEGGADAARRVSEEDLESPFVEFLQKQRLPPKIKSYRSHRPSLFVSRPLFIYFYFFSLRFWTGEFNVCCWNS